MDNKKASDLAAKDLPWIRIHDDDEATKAAGREAVFAELLRILHGKETTKTAKTPPTLRELAILAVFADRFACARPVSAYVRRAEIPISAGPSQSDGGRRGRAAARKRGIHSFQDTDSMVSGPAAGVRLGNKRADTGRVEPVEPVRRAG